MGEGGAAHAAKYNLWNVIFGVVLYSYDCVLARVVYNLRIWVSIQY